MTKTVAVIGLVVMFFIVAFVAVMLLWQWIVPDVFSGAVSQGVLPASLTFVQAIKLSILLTILGLTGRGGSKKS